MGVSNYRELEAWQQAMNLVDMVYRLTTTFPESERFGLVNQLRRAAVSIPSNIAEGQGRRLQKQFAMFLRTSRGSLQEVETQLLIARRLGFADRSTYDDVFSQCATTGRLISGLIRSLDRTGL